MYRFLLSVVIVLLTASPARAEPGLTGAVAAAYFPRTASAELESMASERAAEISACSACMNHDLMRVGTAEVLGFNTGYSDAVGHVIAQWQSSGAHDRILSNQELGRIGCAVRVVSGAHYFACVLAPGPLPAPPNGRSSPVIALPDTAVLP